MRYKSVILWIYFIVLIALVIGGVAFAMNNAGMVVVDFFGKEVPPTPLWVVMLACFLLGFFIGIFLMIWEAFKISMGKKKYKRLYDELMSQKDRQEKTV
ncbi:MAG: LapA family protein [Oligoflexia bacterium]|nr:LapA family protein [Oligoflexia bacterium]